MQKYTHKRHLTHAFVGNMRYCTRASIIRIDFIVASAFQTWGRDTARGAHIQSILIFIVRYSLYRHCERSVAISRKGNPIYYGVPILIDGASHL